MATAKKTESGKWRTLVYIGRDENGKKKYKSITDSDKRRCERRASAFADEHRQILDPVSVGSAIDSFLTLRKEVLSPSTYRAYKSTERYLKSNFGTFCDHSMYDLSPEYMQTIVNEMIRDGQSAKSISNKLGVVSAALKMKNVHMPIVRMPEREKPDFHIPDVKEIKDILKCAEGKDVEIPILLAAYGGMRRSEICALTLDDVIGDTIRITKAIVPDENNESVQKTTKTYESKRDVPMTHEIIKKILKKGYITDTDKPEIISQRFRRVAKKAGYSDVRFHDLRHFHASYLHAKGVPDQYIMARCGWRTDTVMKKVYRHTLQSESDQINKNITGIFSSLF